VDVYWDAKVTRFRDLAHTEIDLGTAGVYRQNGKRR
jgi:hypothetical protein